MRTLDVRPFSLPSRYVKRPQEAKFLDANALDHVCELIETAVNNTVQANGSQLSQDLAVVQRASELAIGTLERRLSRFQWAMVLAVPATAYFVGAKTSRKVYFFAGLRGVWIIVLIVVAVAWLAKPKREGLSRIRGFLNKTARTPRARLDEYFRQLSVPDEDK
jgi:hypothetical protein